MGRGASRSKSGGMTVMKDSERKIIMKNSNISLFEFIQEGCFEKDFMAYCANRLNDYSCVHWLDPDISDVDGFLHGGLNESGLASESGNCYHEGETQTLYMMKLTMFIMPVITFLAITSSILTLVVVNHVAYKFYPLASYLTFIALFDIGDVLIRGGDVLVEVFTQNRVLSAIQILTRSSCQMLPFFYSFFKHAHGSLYLAMAIDNWRFVKNPRHMNCIFRYEWIRNVVIVIAAVLLTLNAQFFWTFDVIENDNKILHNRFVKSTFECSFSTTWPLSQVFTEYIWPSIDHIAGEILPTLICLWFGASYFRSTVDLEPNLKRYIIDLKLLLQMNYSLSVISLLFGIFSLPRVIYFSFKYSYLLFLRSTDKALKENIRSKLEYTFSGGVTFRKEEMFLQYIEFFIKYMNFIFITIKFLVLIRNVDLMRERLCYVLTFCRTKTHQRQLSNSPKTSTLDTVTYTSRSVTFKSQTECVPLFSYTM